MATVLLFHEDLGPYLTPALLWDFYYGHNNTFAHGSVVLLFWFWIVNLFFCTVKTVKHIQLAYKVMKHICI